MPQDFSNIPPPDAIEEVNYEVHFSRMIEQLKLLNDRFTTIKESDPIYTAFQVMAYEISSKVQEMNERVRAVLLLTSTGADLDHLGVIYQEKRRVLSPGNPDVNPPIPAILESDTDYRRRLLSAFKSLALGSSDWYSKLILESGSPFEQLINSVQVLGPEDNDEIDVVDPNPSKQLTNFATELVSSISDINNPDKYYIGTIDNQLSIVISNSNSNINDLQKTFSGRIFTLGSNLATYTARDAPRVFSNSAIIIPVDLSSGTAQTSRNINISANKQGSPLLITPGEVWCYIESLSEETPIPTPELIKQVEDYLDKNLWPDGTLPRSQASLRRFIGDRIKVRSCIQKPYTIQAVITPLVGLDNSQVRNNVESIGIQFARDFQIIGQEVSLSSIYAILHTDQVFKVDLIYPEDNIRPKLNELPIVSNPFVLNISDFVVITNPINWDNFSNQSNKWSLTQYELTPTNLKWYIIFSDLSLEDLNKLQGVGVGRKFNILTDSEDIETTVFSGQITRQLGENSDHYFLELLDGPTQTLSPGTLYISFNSAIDITVAENVGGV